MVLPMTIYLLFQHLHNKTDCGKKRKQTVACIWLLKSEKGHSAICVKCRLQSACADWISLCSLQHYDFTRFFS